MLLYHEEPIVALCTPQGKGALALMRFVGIDVYKHLEPLVILRNEKKLSTIKSHTIHHISLKNPVTGKVIDDCMLFAMRGPKTFTGQDTIELTLHNNPCIISAVYGAARDQGIRKADPGEFSKRALLSDKIDILQAEAIHELITATNENIVDAALQQLHGSLSSYVLNIEEKLLHLLVLVEASFEFLDEEQRDLDFHIQIEDKIKNIIESIATTLSKNSEQQRFKDGIRIALIGSVNAGKSTLFNALVGKDRAIVSAQAGTTRDTIEASQYSNGFFRTYVDTAGLRRTDDAIEKEGIERSWKEAIAADIILLIIDGTSVLSHDESGIYKKLFDAYSDKILVVQTKSDIQSSINNNEYFLRSIKKYAVSASNQKALQKLFLALDVHVQELCSSSKTAYTLNERHSNHLYKVLQLCKQALQYGQSEFQAEM
ncbi:tRNA uridine-5-carboxymethylaminomethyl(34) synthesis GTPase MnmE, partial [Candidatus Babeliales bacterium]|nr:tRNA uridine-5-carboxymethylaminomethyl(34) synthesis GTPase MnmE [Candidatus Babeliales bacterium]